MHHILALAAKHVSDERVEGKECLQNTGALVCAFYLKHFGIILTLLEVAE